jgi:hypothetical protein
MQSQKRKSKVRQAICVATICVYALDPRPQFAKAGILRVYVATSNGKIFFRDFRDIHNAVRLTAKQHTGTLHEINSRKKTALGTRQTA